MEHRVEPFGHSLVAGRKDQMQNWKHNNELEHDEHVCNINICAGVNLDEM